jgi:putative membrane protein
MWYGMMNGYGWGWAVFVHMALWWVLLILAIIVVARWLAGGSSKGSPPREESALDILKKRYARGEVGREEFEQKKRDLEA